MGATVLAILLATGLGLIAGGYYSVVGWIVVATLLGITTAAAVVFAAAPLLTSVLWVVATFVAFDVGLILSLVIRYSGRARAA